MNDQRPAWEPSLLDEEQLDLFAEDDPPVRSGRTAGSNEQSIPRVYQLSELPGESFEDIFGDAA